MIQPFIKIAENTACRIRNLVLFLGFITLYLAWEAGSASPWYIQSASALILIAVFAGILYLLYKYGTLPSFFPVSLNTILQSEPRRLFSTPSLIFMLIALITLPIGVFLYSHADLSGYRLTVTPLSTPDNPEYTARIQHVREILPFDFPNLIKNPTPSLIVLSGYVRFEPDEVYLPYIYSSSGKTSFLVDGTECSIIAEDAISRFDMPRIDSSPGWHRIEIRHITQSTPPMLRLRWRIKVLDSDEEAFPLTVCGIQACIQPWMNPLMRVLSIFCLFIGAILMLSTIISCARFNFGTIKPFPKSVTTALLVLVCLIGIAWGRYSLVQKTGGMIESDEAAFGIMAQRLLRGELPPIFHYGQPYQGSVEVFPLAVLMNSFGSNSKILKLEPCLLYIVFSILLLFLYRRICTLNETLVLLAVLVCSPFLLMWISLKTWFGYAETLGASAIMLCATYFLVYRPGPRDLLWAILLGFAAGVSLYILPFSAPVVLSTIILLAWGRKTKRWRLLLLTVVVMTVVAAPPYILNDLSNPDKSGSFLVKGRQLGPPRIEGERPFFDRFLNECFPVIVGGRAIYDDQRDFPIGDLPRILYFMTLLGFLALLVDLREDFKKLIYERNPGRFLFVMPAFFAIPIGVWSPFGIWPWYFLPVYIALPLVWAAFFKFTFRFAKPVGLAGILICLFVWSSGSSARPELLFQPASLVRTGVILREDNQPIIKTLEKHGIDHVICDQGEDFGPQDIGRDWMGERLTFDSNLNITGIHPLSRRHPHLFADTATADRVAYIFRRSYRFFDFTHMHDEGYQPVTFDRLSQLFGVDYLNYSRVDLDNDVIFFPETDHPSNNKGLWKVTSNCKKGWFTNRMHDNSISSRAYGPTYWSTGETQKPGQFFEIDIGRVIQIQGIVMYHGVKTLDHPKNAKIFVSQDREQWWEMGKTEWDQSNAITSWRHTDLFHARYVRVELTEPTNSWWTVYEVWVI